MNPLRQKYRWFWRWLGRFLLFIVPLELLLPLVPIPPSFEAGVWHGNSYRDRFWTQNRQDHNKLGYRDINWKKSSLSPRLVFLGGSRFYGQYVALEENFSSFIGRATKWETLNFGLPGASIYEADDFIIQEALDHGPQMAVLCYDVNSSLYSIMTREQGGSRFDTMRNILRSSLIFRWLEMAYYTTTQNPQPVMSLTEYRQLLEKNISTLDRAGVDVVMVIGWAGLQDFPQLFSQERYDLFRQESRNVAQKHHIPIIEIEEVFKNQDRETMFVGMEKMHFSTQGHRFFAAHIVEKLGLRTSHAPK